jgi:hypothetical protein
MTVPLGVLVLAVLLVAYLATSSMETDSDIIEVTLAWQLVLVQWLLRSFIVYKLHL